MPVDDGSTTDAWYDLFHDHPTPFKRVAENTPPRTLEAPVELQTRPSTNINRDNPDLLRPASSTGETATLESGRRRDIVELYALDTSLIEAASEESSPEEGDDMIRDSGAVVAESPSVSDAAIGIPPTSPQLVSHCGLATPQETPGRGDHLSEKTSRLRTPELALQTTSQFAENSLQKIEQFRQFEEKPETYKAMYDALKDEQDLGWSDGSQWRHVVVAAANGSLKRTLDLALSSIGFARWHRSQTQLLETSLSSKKAAQQVSGDYLKKMFGDDSTTNSKHRISLNTSLARGRKWARLVDQLGFGVLFMDAWYVSPTMPTTT